MTFDDAVKSHRTFVAPLLKQSGFGATFFVTHRWMDDAEHFLTWREIAEIHHMGFEIGNHSWTHAGFSSPRNAARLAGELALVDYELNKVGVPRPVSFAYSGNAFGPEALRVLAERSYRFARRGMQPEVEYGKLEVGPTFDPARHHPLLIPTTGDAYPNWTFEHFQRVVACAGEGKLVVLQFHGVPDVKHPWVHTPPENFRMYMAYLKESGFRVVALRDLEPMIDREKIPHDPLAEVRFPRPKDDRLVLPVEVEATRLQLTYWLDNMLSHHRFTPAEAAAVCGKTEAEVLAEQAVQARAAREPTRLLPYPGGRHPRIGFQEGAIDPFRGTKASVFLPWDGASYVVIDLPEAIFCDRGLLFLAHTHLPTIWNERNVVLENTDWGRGADGSLSSRWTLPNGVVFGASVRVAERVAMELWLHNGGSEPLKDLRAQVCVMLKGAGDFNVQTNDNKVFRPPVAAVRLQRGPRWILTAWERSRRAWGNRSVPCIHSDPGLADCAPGEAVRVRGQLWFHEGDEIEPELTRQLVLP